MAKPKPKKRIAQRASTTPMSKSTAPAPRVEALPSGGFRWATHARLQAWLVFALGCLLYANTLGHDYTQDDAIVITDNMFTTKGVAGIPGILQYDTFYGFFKEAGKANLVAGGRYRPLTLILFSIEYQLFGDNPFIGHLINALLYGLTGFVLYWLLLQLFKRKENPVEGHFVAFAAGVLFITHPIHTEAVANIKGRDEIVAALGSLAALHFSIKGFLQQKNRLNILVGILFFLALLSKENAITFLAIAPLTYYFFTKATFRQILLQTLPFVIAAIVFIALRTSVIGLGSGEPPVELMNNPFLKLQGNQYVPFSATERAATVLFTLGKYVQLLVFPHPLTHDYYPRQVDIMNFGDWQVWASLALYLAMIGYAMVGFRKKDPMSYGILFFLICLSIVSNIVFPVGTNLAERLLFLPSVGFCLVIAILLQRLFFSKKLTNEKQWYPIFGVLLLLSVLFSVKTITRNPAWRNNYTLFTTDIRTSPNSAKLRNAVGGELVTQSVNEKDEQRRVAMLQEAAGHLREAVKIHPTYKNAYLLLGNCYNYLQQYDPAIEYYQKALALDPNYQDAFNNLAITYQQAGRYHGEQRKDLLKALTYLRQAYQIKPDDYETVRLLGVAYGISGRTQEAIEFFTKGTQLQPDNAGAWYDLGSAYHNAGNPEKGKEYIDKAQSMDTNIRLKR